MAMRRPKLWLILRRCVRARRDLGMRAVCFIGLSLGLCVRVGILLILMGRGASLFMGELLMVGDSLLIRLVCCAVAAYSSYCSDACSKQNT